MVVDSEILSMKNRMSYFASVSCFAPGSPNTEGSFIADFKKAEVCPLHKDDGRVDKSNYQSISILY